MYPVRKCETKRRSVDSRLPASIGRSTMPVHRSAMYSQEPLPLPATFRPPGVLLEPNAPHPRLRHPWLAHLSESSQRRHEALQARRRLEKLRRRRAVRRREYQRLRSMVPSIAKKPAVDKVTVIEEAIRYIDYLHGALLTRLRTKGLPSCLRGVDIDMNNLSLEGIKALVCQLVEKNNQLKRRQQQQQQASALERTRPVPSYLAARPPLPKRT